MCTKVCPFFGMNPICYYCMQNANMSNPALRSLSRDIPKPKKSFSTEEAIMIGEDLGINWNFNPFNVEQYRMGLDVELEHGTCNPFTNITDDDSITTGKITLAHLNEYPDYYTRLSKMEHEAEAYWKKNKQG